MTLPRCGTDDLTAARDAVLRGSRSAAVLLAECGTAADAPLARNVFLRRFTVDDAGTRGLLAGLAVSVKALFDVAGAPTTAASASLHDAPPAARDSLAVARLRAAGAALVGHTNMSEFAFSGVGTNLHHGTPLNAATAAFDPVPRIPGGSTSGGATSVACGAAWAALGSDTGGSIRIPAALQGLVGYKNTQALTPLAGSVPLSPTLDTACAITLSVRDAVLLHEVLAARRVSLAHKPLAAMRFAVPTTLMVEGLEPVVAAAFESALALLQDAGAAVETIVLPQLTELAGINAAGGFAAAESWAWHRQRLAERADLYDPRVALRIRRGAAMVDSDLAALHAARRDWIGRTAAALQGYDAALSPTVPMAAPPVARLLHDDAAFFAINALLLRNPSVVNFLDGCAISLPCHPSGSAMPVGLMLWAPAHHDDALLAAAVAVEQRLAAR